MNEVKTKQVRVFVGGGKSFFTAGPAYRKAAWRLLMAKHCKCDLDISDGQGNSTSECIYHAGGGWYGMRVVHRLVRLWMRRDKVQPGAYRLACRYQEENWGGSEHNGFGMRPRKKSWSKTLFMTQIAALREIARRHPEEYQGLMAATAAEEVLK
jgi:hypothetical protein